MLDITATHALVRFEDEECSAVIPLGRVMDMTSSLKKGDNIQVLWDNRKQYAAKFLLSGIMQI